MVFVKNDAVNVELKSKISAFYIEKRTYEDKSLSTQVRFIYSQQYLLYSKLKP